MIVITGKPQKAMHAGGDDRQSSCGAFWATVCKKVRPMLSDRCPVLTCLSVCNVGVPWPNGWTDQDETWHADRPRSWPQCVRWEPSSPSHKGAQPKTLRCNIIG